MNGSEAGAPTQVARAPEPGAAGPRPGTPARTSLARAIDDRLNPVLVREVRQALRGRWFRVVFALTVSGAAILAMSLLTEAAAWPSAAPTRNFGPELFTTLHACLSIAVLGFVPLGAFTSMGAEWEENTHDLLSISKLRPRHVVLGKLGAAAIEMLLHLSAFGPFLVSAFLLRGIGIGTILFILAATAGASLSLSLIALALSSLEKRRIARVVLMSCLACGLAAAVVATIVLTKAMIRSNALSTSRDMIEASLVALFVIGVPGLVALALACERLAHPEENHSTTPRAVATAILVTGVAAYGFAYLDARSSRYLVSFGVLALAFAAGYDLFFVTEAETLPRRVRAHLPRGRLASWLAVPWLPGGGRGFCLWLLHASVVLGATAALIAFAPPSRPGSGLAGSALARLAGFAAYLTVYLGLPSLLALGWSARAETRWRVRLAIPGLVAATVFLPAFFGAMLGIAEWTRLEHPLNPVVVLDGVRGGESAVAAGATLVALLVVIVNLGRIVGGFTEVEAARRRLERVR